MYNIICVTLYSRAYPRIFSLNGNRQSEKRMSMTEKVPGTVQFFSRVEAKQANVAR